MSIYYKAKIYKLVRNKSNLVYYGSTCQDLDIRLKQHMTSYKNGNKKISSYNLFISNGDISIKLIKNYPCRTRKELEREEGNYIKTHLNKNTILNKYIAGRTRAEYMRQYKNKNKSK
jgi:hypothetical protein